jgi:hypothetical protein
MLLKKGRQKEGSDKASNLVMSLRLSPLHKISSGGFSTLEKRLLFSGTIRNQLGDCLLTSLLVLSGHSILLPKWHGGLRIEARSLDISQRQRQIGRRNPLFHRRSTSLLDGYSLKACISEQQYQYRKRSSTQIYFHLIEVYCYLQCISSV